MARVIRFPIGADVCTICQAPRSAHFIERGRPVLCPRELTAAEVAAHLQITLRRCLPVRPFAVDVDTEVSSR